MDNSQTTVDLLSHITVQIQSFQLAQGFLNSTAVLPAHDSSSFVPTTSARLVNILLFLSLSLSLAAAFFGILVKQWLREYMKWHAPMGDPKENVLVRHIRFEAWRDWNVETSISLIPGMLELAVVLFFIGLVILMWTVDAIVAIVISVAVFIFLVIASSVTILPVFFKRCPYKSPTSRGFVVLYELCKEVTFYVYHSLRRTNSLRNVDTSWNIPSWRDREIADSCLYTLRDGQDKLSNAVEVFGRELQGHVRSSCDSTRALLEMGKASTLVRALSWVSQASHDERVVTNVALSAESLHSSDVPYDIRYLSTVYLLTCNIGRDATRALSFDVSDWLPMLPDYALPKLDGTMSTLLQALDLCYHKPEKKSAPTRGIRMNGQGALDGGFGLLDRTWDSKRNWFCTRLQFNIFLRVLVGEIKTTTLKLIPSNQRRPTFTEPLSIGCRVMGLLCALHRIIRAAQFKRPDIDFHCNGAPLQPLLDAYNTLLNDHAGSHVDEDWCPGLRTSILATICTFVDAQLDNDGRLRLGMGWFPPTESVYTKSWYHSAVDHSRTSETSSSATLARLITDYGHSMRGRTYRREDCACLVALTNIFLRGLVWKNIMPEPGIQSIDTETVGTVLESMESVARISLGEMYPNCGSYKKLPWLSTFNLRNFWLVVPAQMSLLFEALEQCNDAGLFTDDVKEQFVHARGTATNLEIDPAQRQLGDPVLRSIDFLVDDTIFVVPTFVEPRKRLRALSTPMAEGGAQPPTHCQ